MRRLFLAIGVAIATLGYGNSITERIESIPLIERSQIERLFQYLFWDELFCYTLDGSKPLSTASIHKSSLLYGFFHPRAGNQLKIDWETWKKYSDKFPISKFEFYSLEESDWFEIRLANKSLIQNTMNLFPELFNQGEAVESYTKNHATFGLLLGYGVNNSKSFNTYYTSDYAFLLKPPELIEQKDDCVRCNLPFFASFLPTETTTLNERYSKERESIMKKYSSSNFLETFLNVLTEETRERKA